MRLTTIFVPFLILMALFSGFVGSTVAARVLTYTSTADFDSGISAGDAKWMLDYNAMSVSGYSQAIYNSGGGFDRTYVAFANLAILPYVTYYDHKAETWATPVRVDNNPTAPGDGHGIPAMWIDSQGYIYIEYGAHITPSTLLRSTLPYNIETWTPLGSIDPVFTYAYFFEQPAGTLWVFYRDAVADGGNWAFKTSTNRGATWSAATIILDMGGLNGQYPAGYGYDAATSRMWWGWVLFNNADTTRIDLYTCQFDVVTRQLWSTDGLTNLGTLIDGTEADTYCKVYDSGTDQIPTATFKLFNGQPYFIFNQGFDSGATHSWNIRYKAPGASPVNIAAALATSSYADMAIHSATDIDAYINTGRNTGCSGDCIYTGNIEHWSYNGAWTKTATLLQDVAAGAPVNFPVIPSGYHDNLKVLFGDFGGVNNGVYYHGYAWGDRGFLRGGTSSYTHHLETPTTNSNLAAGEMRLATYETDSFTGEETIASATVETERWSSFNHGDGTASCSNQITGGQVRFSFQEVSGLGRRNCMIQLKSEISGDFDMAGHFETDVYPPGGTVSHVLCASDQLVLCTEGPGLVPGQDSVFVTCIRTATENLLRTYKVTAGIQVQTGTEYTTQTCASVDLRISRTNDDFVTYWSGNGGNTWTQFTLTAISDLFSTPIVAQLFQRNLPTVPSGLMTSRVDNFRLTSGTASPRFVERGVWSSPAYEGAEPIDIITIDHSFIGSGSSIQIQVTNEQGDVRWRSSIITSGSSSSFAPPAGITNDWSSIQVLMASSEDGTASPVITSLSATLLPIPVVEDDRRPFPMDLFRVVLFLSIATVCVFLLRARKRYVRIAASTGIVASFLWWLFG
jgi:hypothetical protein